MDLNNKKHDLKMFGGRQFGSGIVARVNLTKAWNPDYCSRADYSLPDLDSNRDHRNNDVNLKSQYCRISQRLEFKKTLPWLRSAKFL